MMNEFGYPKHLFDTIGEIVEGENANGVIVDTVTATLDNGAIRVTVEGITDDEDMISKTHVFRVSATGGIIR